MRTSRASLPHPLPTLCVIRSWFLATLVLASASNHVFADTDDLVVGKDYVRGEVIFAFREGSMPSDVDLSRSAGRVGVPAIDSVLAGCLATSVVKLVVGRDTPTQSDDARRFERTFLLRYDSALDPKDVVAALSSKPYFDYVIINRIVEKEYFALRRWTPPPTPTTKFTDQWYFHNPHSDKLDIDNARGLGN